MASHQAVPAIGVRAVAGGNFDDLGLFVSMYGTKLYDAIDRYFVDDSREALKISDYRTFVSEIEINFIRK